MLRPVALPIVVQADLYGLVPLIDAVGKKVLNASVFGKRDVRPDIEQEPALVAERRRVPAIVSVLVIHHGGNSLGVKPVCGSEPGHSRSQDHDTWCWHRKLLLNFFGLRPCDRFSYDRSASVLGEGLILLDLISGETLKIDSTLKTLVPLDDPSKSRP